MKSSWTERHVDFLHCEREREAVERLLSSGPEAFYSSVGTERSGCFLSSEEVSQITSWAQNYEFNGLQQENSVGCSSAVHEDFCSTYFPGHTDVPAPNLELGWPVKSPWVPQGSVTTLFVGKSSVSRVVQVIAIVTDRLTDGAIIWDLHNAASRGVPVYIILNQRSIQETVTLNRLRHPVSQRLHITYTHPLNMQVRVLGGTSFCSRAGRMVVGEMKNKFLLVDLETVIHGSYSLTWTDAHLHRQLITVLSGPVVDTFDKEFRILFAASLPVPNTWRVAANNAHVPHHLKDFPPLQFHKQVPLEPEIFSPPSPPADFLMDWEAMGVIQRDCSLPGSSLDQHEETMDKEPPLQNNVLFDKNTAIMDRFTKNGNQLVDKKRYRTTNPHSDGEFKDVHQVQIGLFEL
uniref:Family with sequence similarity 83 member E n=1 Tax=Stegastes partitus TaxID=144197 RepID=A0A3B5A6Q8_9TELE